MAGPHLFRHASRRCPFVFRHAAGQRFRNLGQHYYERDLDDGSIGWNVASEKLVPVLPDFYFAGDLFSIRVYDLRHRIVAPRNQPHRRLYSRRGNADPRSNRVGFDSFEGHQATYKPGSGLAPAFTTV